MKITVLGGSGFLGSHVSDELSNYGHKVKIFDIKKSKWLKKNQKMYIGSILSSQNLEKAIKGSDIVFNFAALADLDQALKEPISTAKTNILGNVLALECSRKHKIKRFIYASSIYVNSTEGGFYRSSKKAAEDYVEEYKKIYNLDYTILRFGSLYGKRASNTNGVRKIIKNAITKKEISYNGSKRAVREYISVADAAEACVEVLKKKYNNKHIILTGKRKIKVSTFLVALSKILKISKKIRFKNVKDTGHYVVSPYTYKPEKGKKFLFKSSNNFFDELPTLINEIKKD